MRDAGWYTLLEIMLDEANCPSSLRYEPAERRALGKDEKGHRHGPADGRWRLVIGRRGRCRIWLLGDEQSLRDTVCWRGDV